MKFCAYATSRPIGQFVMPVPAQNSCLREYASRNNLEYVMPQLEHKYQNCYMQLYSVIENSEKNDIIGLYSLETFRENPKKSFEIVKYGLKKGNTFHFVLENLSIKSIEEFMKVLKTWFVQKNIKKLCKR
jgi:sporadic carbohydrate cluster protein (TIGR04323 family)